MSHTIPEPDPRSRFEDEGIPDLQDGTPEQQWAVDPQEAPLPGDRPVAVDDYGTTIDEEIQGEPLDLRLSREEPDQQASYGASALFSSPRQDSVETESDDDQLTADGGLGPGSDLDTEFQPDAGVPPEWAAQPAEPSGRIWEEPRPAGRLVAPDEGAHPDSEADAIAHEVGPDSGGYSAEEAAMRVEPEPE